MLHIRHHILPTTLSLGEDLADFAELHEAETTTLKAGYLQRSGKAIGRVERAAMPSKETLIRSKPA